jgi:hypothetical protein
MTTKILTLSALLILTLSLSFNASAAQSSSNWTTNNLTDGELETIDNASQDQIYELSDCMSDANETQISETSCINDVFGDVHN